MALTSNYIIHKNSRHLKLDTRDSAIGSFTEFIPFCPHLYYFSSFKLFKTITQA